MKRDRRNVHILPRSDTKAFGVLCVTLGIDLLDSNGTRRDHRTQGAHHHPLRPPARRGGQAAAARLGGAAPPRPALARSAHGGARIRRATHDRPRQGRHKADAEKLNRARAIHLLRSMAFVLDQEPELGGEAERLDVDGTAPAGASSTPHGDAPRELPVEVVGARRSASRFRDRRRKGLARSEGGEFCKVQSKPPVVAHTGLEGGFSGGQVPGLRLFAASSRRIRTALSGTVRNAGERIDPRANGNRARAHRRRGSIGSRPCELQRERRPRRVPCGRVTPAGWPGATSSPSTPSRVSARERLT